MTAPALPIRRPLAARSASMTPLAAASLLAQLHALASSRVARTLLVLVVAAVAFALAMLHQTDPFGTPATAHPAVHAARSA